MHVDFTFGRVNGKQGSVMICVSEGQVLEWIKEAIHYRNSIPEAGAV
ncbi:hypothetical protein [Lactonifactor longoviformis]|nr:hypothetical protein [Lactonifactor longoviformis]